MAVSRGTRIFAGGMALLFLLTASTFTFAVIYDMVTSDDQQSDTSQQDGKLAGTKLKSYTPVEKVDELKTIDKKAGGGAVAKESDVVTVHYIGALASTGEIFESSLDSGQPVSFSLDGVIKGWTEGIPGMKEGGVRRLLIPAEKAYGDSPPPGAGIPAGADLVFDVTLISVGQ